VVEAVLRLPDQPPIVQHFYAAKAAYLKKVADTAASIKN